MSIEQALIATLKDMPPDEQRQVLNYAQSLRKRAKPPLQEVRGLWADLGLTITQEDIARVRREMWKNFPREISL